MKADVTSLENLYRGFESQRKERLGGALPTWADALVQQAHSEWTEHGLPNRKNERWKYTSLDFLKKSELVPTGAGPQKPIDWSENPDLQAFFAMDAYRLVFNRGEFLDTQSTALPESCFFRTLPELLTTQVDAHGVEHFRDTLKRELADDEANSDLLTLSNSFLLDGFYLSIPRGQVIEKPLVILHLGYGDAEKETAVFTQSLIDIGPASDLRVLEVYWDLRTGSYFQKSHARYCIGEGAHLQRVVLQNEGPQARHIHGFSSELGRSANLTNSTVTLAAGLSRHNVRVDLMAEGAEAQVDGLYMTEDGEHSDHNIVLNHSQPNTTSRQLYKGVLSGRSRAVFNGKVVIHPKAQKSNAEQLNKNLLLSARAEVDTKPELEVYADDVKAGHGATTGQLNPDEIFYLCSRGIDGHEATRMVAEGFAREVIYRIPDETLRTTALEYLNRSLKDLDLMQESK